MGVEVKYVCDNCGHEQSKPEQMWKVGVMCEHEGSHFHFTSTYTYKNQRMWCRACVDKFDLLGNRVQTKGDHGESQPEPSLGEKLVGIIESIARGAS